MLSASSVSAYRACEYRYFLSYVEVRPETQNIKAVRGIAVHAGAEVLLRAQMAGDDPDAAYARAQDAVASSLGDDLLFGDVRPDPKISERQAFVSAYTCLAVYRSDVLPTIEHPTGVEVEFQFAVDGISYSGIIDALADDLHDLKTTASRPSNGDRYDLAMTGYDLGYREITGHAPRSIVLDYIVATQKPYYWPIRRDPATDEDIDRFASVVGGVARGIAEGNFRPTGLETRGCSWCPHKETCVYYAATQEGEPNDCTD